MNTPLIVLEDIQKHYEPSPGVITPVLKSINLTIDAGEFVAIMGPSGSGKSTMMNILGTLDRASSGSYQLEGREISSIPNKQLAATRNELIGFVFQGFNLLPRRTVLENIALPLFYAGMGRAERLEQAAYYLRQVGLPKHADYYPQQLSGGQQQRVAIARALAHKPRLILADEPTGNLDSVTSDEIMSIFTALNSQNITVIIVTHEREVGEMADRLIQLKDGSVIYDGPSAKGRH